MDFFSWVPAVLNKLWPTLMDLWEAWSIQLLVLAGLVFQLILAIFGSRRRVMTGFMIRFIVWASYLLSAYVAALALGKLTVIRINDPNKPDYDTELKALMAPLLLVLLGNPDTITAYSVEDNSLGVRQVLNLILTVSFVIWILIRCWDKSKAATLYFPMFVAGIIKYAETVWALGSVYSENTSITVQEIKDQEKAIPDLFIGLPGNINRPDIFLRAYYRFDCLKPHLVSWLYHPLFISQDWMSLDGEKAEDAFLTTDIELGFMYDVLYTKSPVLYTRLGIALRLMSYFCLLSSLSGFSCIFKNGFLIDLYVAYTYVVLIGVGIMETYQILHLPFSDWAIVKMIKYHRKPLVSTILPYIANRSLRKKRWSDRMGQFNLLDYCLHEKWPNAIKILKVLGKEEEFKIHRESKSQRIPSYVKQILLRDMMRLDQMRGFSPFNKRGEWTITLEDVEQSPDPRQLKWSIEMPFDKSIILWHIATDICYSNCNENADDCRASKLFSDYMMFLLVQRPYILSLTTTNITFEHTYFKLKAVLQKHELFTASGGRSTALKVLSEPVDHIQGEKLEETGSSMETFVTEGWDVLGEAQRLADELKCRGDTWRVISCVWVEMICYAAYNCRVYQHEKLLRRGGDIITHVWLLIAHKTDKFNSSMDKQTTKKRN